MPFIITCVASKKGLGATSKQKLSSNLETIALASYKMILAREKSPFDMLYQYIFGRKFRIENDDKSLKTILTKPIREVIPQMQHSMLSKPNQFVRLLHKFNFLC